LLGDLCPGMLGISLASIDISSDMALITRRFQQLTRTPAKQRIVLGEVAERQSVE